MKKEIQDIITKMLPLTNKLSKICKSGTFELPNGRITVEFDEQA